MKTTILAIDTSGLSASAAVVRGEKNGEKSEDKLLGEFFVSLNLTHSQTIMPMVDSLLKTIGLTPADMDFFAVSSGPGSFTGLRIGAAAVQGLAFALNKYIVPVPTLDALAYNVINAGGLVVPVMDARRGQVYTALYNCGIHGTNLPNRLTDYMADDLENIFDIAEEKSRGGIIFTGDGADAYKDQILARGHQIAPPHLNRTRAAAVGALAIVLAQEGKAVAPDNFAPFYIRKPQAEQKIEVRG